MKSVGCLASLLVMFVCLTAFAAPLGSLPAAIHYVSHDVATAAFAKGGTIVKDPGFVILANRKGAGAVEYHEHTSHTFIIVEGEATLVVGGTLINPKRASQDQMTGSSIEGGTSYHVTPGDVITIPARTPHWWKEVPSKTVAYYAINIEDE